MDEWYTYICMHTCVQSPRNLLLLQEVEEAWSKKYQEFRQHWAHLSAAIKGSAIEPIEVDCTAELEEMQRSAVVDLEGRQHLHYYGTAVLFHFHFLECKHLHHSTYTCLNVLRIKLYINHNSVKH